MLKLGILLLFFSLAAFSRTPVWVSGGFFLSQISDMAPKEMGKKQTAHGFNFAAEVSPGTPHIAAHYGYRDQNQSSAQYRPGSMIDETKSFTLSQHEVGVKFFRPVHHMELFAGLGAIFGNATLGGESRSALGPYWNLGIDFFRKDRPEGLRFEYQGTTLRTERFNHLSKRRLSFDQSSFSLALVLGFGKEKR